MVKQIPTLLKALHERCSPKSVNEDVDQLTTLPSGVLNGLLEKLKTLDVPDPYLVKVRLAAREAIQAWQTNPDTVSNSLVVLSRPVEAITPILKEGLQDYLVDCDVDFFLSAYRRSSDPLSITEHLKQELEPEEMPLAQKKIAPVTQTDIHEHTPRVVVIPNLEQCFLRCIQGWEGIEYFQTLSTQDTSRFWVFGCNHWAWAFLDKVCQVSAYLERTVTLPELTADDLQSWLRPLITAVVTKANGEGFKLEVKSDGKDYWDTLANLAFGNGAIASHLWLKSLRMKSEDLTAEGTLPTDAMQIHLVLTKPVLPTLMTLEPMDRYLLHSLLLHGKMTRSHLALSLGETERAIRSRVQVLRRESILIQKGQYLSVHPAYYPKLRTELSNNNFLIGQA